MVAFLTPLRSEARRASNHARAGAALRGIAPCPPRARGAPGGRGIVLAGKRIVLTGGSGDDDGDSPLLLFLRISKTK